jgi:hypothetical protein
LTSFRNSIQDIAIQAEGRRLSAGRWWSVKLRVEERELGPITAMPDPGIIEGMRHVRFGGASDDADDPPSVTFELQAPDPATAEERAQSVAAQLRSAVKLPEALLPIVWLAPIGADDASSRFLEEAQNLIASEQYGLAVVAAQIHFEVQLRVLLEEAAGENLPRWAARLLTDRGIAELKRPPSLATVELLLGVDVTQFQEWQRFKAHIDRRNDVVHRGQAVALNQAKESVAVVRELWTRLADARRSKP